MFQPPEHSHNLSLRLTSVLDDIGVNEKMVIKRRRTYMFMETMFNIESKLTGKNMSLSFFGSQTEGSTTPGLNSDIDALIWGKELSVIQHWSEWDPDKAQFLMIQDENTSPGYCLLQAVRSDLPLPAHGPIEDDHTIDNTGRVLLRASPLTSCIEVEVGIIHGPARTGQTPYGSDIDVVEAIHCSSWPREAYPWVQQQNVSGWPTADMKKYSFNQGCFVVPVSSRTGLYPGLEWRISTSSAKRCLMYSLNITQLSCYILMKTILKTFLKPICEDAISSFMCKNILFHCIAGLRSSSSWNESSLLTRLKHCLQALLNCILTEHCPHYIIPGNNLLAGKLSAAVKHRLVDVMCSLTGNIEETLLAINMDNLGNRLRLKSSVLSGVYFNLQHEISISVAYTIIKTLANNLQRVIKDVWKEGIQNVADYQTLKECIRNMCIVYFGRSGLDQSAVSILAPFICTSIGSMRASEDIHLSRTISSEALRWFSLGLNSDASSSRLKIASALYCAGDLDRCELSLFAIRAKLSQTNILNQCCCFFQEQFCSEEFGTICYEKNEKFILQQNMALCVTYLPGEYNCIPDEMKYEMFRSTEEDRPNRNKDDDWMDWAVVDSLPYLYFLQYKVYSQLHRRADQHRALDNLVMAINTEDKLGHRETALNLLGQCMEQENSNQAALCCYMISLNVRERNNAAKWHLCRLLAGLFRQ